MQAIQIRELGGPEVLRPAEVADPHPGEGQIVVAVSAAGLNYIDTYHRRGLYPMELPFVPGLEGAGRVIEIGPGVESVAAGDHVAWTGGLGSYAERVVLEAERTIPVPRDVDLETAAAAMLQGLTAHYLATDTHRLQPGDRCLIHAGAGGVGSLLIQMAKLRGAEVFTTVSAPDKEALAREAGADHVMGYADFVEDIETLAGTRPLDVVYDGVGASTFERGLQLLRPRGLMALFGQASGPVEPVDLQVLAQNGSLYVTRPTLFDYVARREELERRSAEMFEWIADGRLEIRIGQRWPLAEAADAHRALEARATTGKTLLIP